MVSLIKQEERGKEVKKSDPGYDRAEASCKDIQELKEKARQLIFYICV